MTIQNLQEQVSKNLSHGKLTINDTLLGLSKYSGFFGLYKIEGIYCTGAAVGEITGSQFTVSATGIEILFGFKGINLSGGQGIVFSVDDSGEAQISFTYNLQNTNLSQVISNFFGLEVSNYLPSYINTLGSGTPTLTISTSPVTFQFGYAVTLNIFEGCPLNLSVTLDLGKNDKDYTLNAGGNVSLADQEFTLTYSSQDYTFTGAWQSSGAPLLTNVIDAMGFSPQYSLSDYSIIDITLDSATFTYTYNTSDKSAVPQLNFSGVTTIDNEQLTIDVGATSQSEYYAAVYLNAQTSLSSLSSGLSLFDGIVLDNALLVLSGFENPTFAFQNIPYTGITKGVELRAVLTMAASGSGVLATALGYLEDVFDGTTVNVTISYDDGDFSLTGEVDTDTKLNFPNSVNKYCTINDISLTISTESPQITLGCGLSVDYNFDTSNIPSVTQVQVNGEVAFGCTEQSATVEFTTIETTSLTDPFGISGLTIDNVGVAVGGTISDSVGADIFVLLQGDFIVQTANGQVPGSLGVSVELVDEAINIPYLECSTTKPYTLQEVWDACSILPAPQFLGDVTIDKLNFYFCDQSGITLPDGKEADKGVNFLANFSIGDFVMFCSLSLSSDAVAGELLMSPISLSYDSIPIASVTGNSPGNLEYGISKGGAAFDCNLSTDGTETISTTVDATILGIAGVQVAANIAIGDNDSNTLSLSLDTNIDIIGDTTFDFNFTSLTDMLLTYKVVVPNYTYAISNVLGLGNINIGGTGSNATDLTIRLLIGASESVYTASISCDFTWFNTPITLNADVSANLTDLTQLMTVIENELENQASELLNKVLGSDAGKYIEAIIQGFIENGEYVLNILVSAFHVASDDLATLFSDIVQINKTGHIDYQVNFHVDHSITVNPPPVSLDFGHIDTILHTNVSVTIPLPNFSIPIINVSANQHLDFATTAIHVDVSDTIPIVDPPHLDIEGYGVGLTATLNFDVDASIPLGDFFDTNGDPNSDVDLDVHVNVVGKAQLLDWSDTASFSFTID
jgi:hypothetical protein